MRLEKKEASGKKERKEKRGGGELELSEGASASEEELGACSPSGEHILHRPTSFSS